MKVKLYISLFLSFSLLLFAVPKLNVVKDTVVFAINKGERLKRTNGYSQPIKCGEEIKYIDGNGIIDIIDNNSKIYTLSSQNDIYTPPKDLCLSLPKKILASIHELGRNFIDTVALTDEVVVSANGSRGSRGISEYDISIKAFNQKDKNKIYLMYGTISIFGGKPKLYLYKNEKLVSTIDNLLIEDDKYYYLFKIPFNKLHTANRYEIKSYDEITVKGRINEQQ